jgi:hypothetical protein
MNKMKLFFAMFLAVAFSACSSSEIKSNLPPDSSGSTIPPSFALSSDFPADIVIPDIDGMRDTAFIVSASDPAAVIAVDIDKNPMGLSSRFEGLINPDGSGIPSKLIISARDEAFLITSSSIIYFDPVDGHLYYNTSALEPIEIGSGLKNSDGSDADATITPAYPSGIARIGDKLFVSSSNYITTENPAVAAPGTIQVFEVRGHELIRTGYIVTSGYNPTGLAVRNGSELVVTNSGVLSIVDAEGKTLTKSSMDIIDADDLTIKSTIGLGLAAASFHAPAITYDGSRAFIGSFAHGNVYEIDLINKQVLRGTSNPIKLTNGSDYITDVELSVDNAFLFAASFEESAVYPFDMREGNSISIGDPFVVGFPSGVTDENPTGANTGAGPMAVRPGTRGENYDGADLFVLTGYPGTLVAIETDAPAKEYDPGDATTPDDEYDDSPPPAPPEGDDGKPCQGFAQAVADVNYGSGAGFGQSGFPDIVLGPPQGRGATMGSLHVLSLGKGGSIVMDLGNCKAVDGAGVDFVVFENAFYIGGNESAPFAELATVSVSSDGEHFTEFPCNSDSYPYEGCAGWHPVYSNPSNDISPFDYPDAGGDAFDLSDIGVAEARYIKIEDIGTGGGSGTTAGFDLDAVAVINGEIEN